MRKPLWRPLSYQQRLRLLLLPYLSGILLLVVLPGLLAFGLAFFRYDGLSPPTWLGTLNFLFVTTDELFLLSIQNSLALVILPVPLRVFGAFLLAVLLRRGIEPREGHGIALPGLEPRGALLVEAEAASGPLRVIAVHLGLRRRDRVRQIAAIRAALAARAPMPTVVMGDFNEWSRLKGLEGLGGYEVLAPGRSFHTLHPLGHLDRIALGEGIAARDAGVADTALARRASDHLPVWADVGVPAA